MCGLRASFSGSFGRACSAGLADGRSLVTGGRNRAGALASAAYFETDGRLTPAAPMLEPRADHVCVALEDGTVLVADGDSGKNGATNAAEMFHPDDHTWTPAGPMLTVRRRAAAVLLKDGKAVVIGGEVFGIAANTLEIDDPAAGRFTQAGGILSPPRAGHAVALLDDGRVIIAGGVEGKRVLDSIDIFDAAPGVISSGGPLSSPRANFTATTPAGGKVWIVGGTRPSSSSFCETRSNPLPKLRPETAPASPIPLGSSTPTPPSAPPRPPASRNDVINLNPVLEPALDVAGCLANVAIYPDWGFGS